jgi:mxaJ protein
MRSIALLLLLAAAPAAARELRVCADPNNLPFSNSGREGFENRIVELVAHELGLTVRYTWWAQRRGFVRNTLNEARCDLWPGVASGVDTLATSVPYYRSSYVFVTRADRALDSLSFDDPRLRTASIGVQLIGDDANNTPPAHAIARRGLISNVRGYPVYGDYDRPNPAAGIIDAVATGTIDIAIVWGPPAGYFALHARTPLRVQAVGTRSDANLPMTYDISMGVRKGNEALLTRVNDALSKQSHAIANVLSDFAVPRTATRDEPVAP